jgi:hypothetical protein
VLILAYQPCRWPRRESGLVGGRTRGDLQLWAIWRLMEIRNRLTCKKARFRLQSPELRGTQVNRAEGKDPGALSSRVPGAQPVTTDYEEQESCD